jgi:hypothetical protein
VNIDIEAFLGHGGKKKGGKRKQVLKNIRTDRQ